ncbi:uncharacterized protein [Physcomitrium patens]|uniref:uncharacterized protein isoform X3 n=1 Tax=Physcomitrium patens TaxID=3218 RepID=UPI000D1740CE|nr:uncharacterized protein LOC112278526 isoform X3 [Physcomitrium patens]|eukprot:XP_024367906.1 uncharacterized protein LOC112278526 isoform X3 [Physcomitrella patens]
MKLGNCYPYLMCAKMLCEKKPTSEQQDREIGTKLRGVSNGSPSVDELLKTVKRLEKGFLTLADAVIAEIEGIREDARCWQEEREELWKTVMTIHQSHQKTEVDPIHHRLQSLQKRASDIEKQLQSHDSDARVPVNDRLEELERRAYELEKQAQKQHIAQDKRAGIEEVVRPSNIQGQHKCKLEVSRCSCVFRYSDPETAVKSIHQNATPKVGGSVIELRQRML